MKKFFEDFKQFALKGNIIDMAVGVVIGAAFGKIVTSLVSDIITPIISLLTGRVNVAELKWVISPEKVDEAGNVIKETALTYGNFIQCVIDFLIVAFSIFVVLKIFMRAQEKMDELKKALEKKEAEAEEEAPAEEVPADTELSVLLEIRDSLKKSNE